MFQPSSFGEVQQRQEAPSALSPLEWQVVLLATRDADRGGWLAGEPRFPRLRRLFEWLTGTRGIQRLADERLEKLRLFICMKRRGDKRAASVAGDLIAMGFVPVALRNLETAVVR